MPKKLIDCSDRRGTSHQEDIFFYLRLGMSLPKDVDPDTIDVDSSNASAVKVFADIPPCLSELLAERESLSEEWESLLQRLADTNRQIKELEAKQK